MISLMLLSQNDGKYKGRKVYNGKPTSDWISREEKLSPTVENEALILTCMVGALEERDVVGSDLHNSFVQVNLPEAEEKERVCMKIMGQLLDWMVDISPETYKRYVVLEQGEKCLYVTVLKVI